MPIQPTEHALLRGAVFGFDTYEAYRADSESEASAFLDRVAIIEGQYYVVVEFPGGVIAKDSMGPYRPSAGWRGNDWNATKYSSASSPLWKHAPP